MAMQTPCGAFGVGAIGGAANDANGPLAAPAAACARHNAVGSLAAAKEAASSACWHEREGLFEMPKATLASHTPRHGVVVVVLGVVVGVVVVAAQRALS